MKNYLAIAAIGCAMSGCATVNPMAFNKTATSIDTSKKSVLLMAVDVSRSDDSRYVPMPMVIMLEKPGAKDKADRQNFKLDEADAVPEAGHSVYLARMAIEPGHYQMTTVYGQAKAFPFFGQFFVPLMLDLDVKPNSVTYIGRVTAKLRPRKEPEFRAGPVIPLLDQSVTGLSGGTWDVTVDDASAKDLNEFRNAYPVLVKTTVDTALLPAFDRAAAQRWWDGQQAQQAAAAPAATTAATAPAAAATATPATATPATSTPASAETPAAAPASATPAAAPATSAPAAPEAQPAAASPKAGS